MSDPLRPSDMEPARQARDGDAAAFYDLRIAMCGRCMPGRSGWWAIPLRRKMLSRKPSLALSADWRSSRSDHPRTWPYGLWSARPRPAAADAIDVDHSFNEMQTMGEALMTTPGQSQANLPADVRMDACSAGRHVRRTTARSSAARVAGLRTTTERRPFTRPRELWKSRAVPGSSGPSATVAASPSEEVPA